MAAASHGVANTQEVGFQYRGNGLSISHDLTCIEDKIEAVRAAVRWRLAFVADKQPMNAEDKRLLELIKHNAHLYEYSEVDNMIEFDIRKKFWSRSLFWLLHHHNYKISFKRYLYCVFRAVKHRFI